MTAAMEMNGVRLWQVDPAMLQLLSGSAIGPVGWWVQEVDRHADHLALVSWFGPNADRWALLLVDTATGQTTPVTHGQWSLAGMAFTPSGKELRWVSHRKGGDPNFSDGFWVRSYHVLTGEVTDLLEFEVGHLTPQEVAFLDRGTRLGVFGIEDPEHDGTHRVVVVDLATGATQVDVLLQTTPALVEVREDLYEYGWVRPGWDDERDRLYLPHIGAEAITTVDLRSGETVTSEVLPQASRMERLLAAWIPTAQAKGPSSFRSATLAPDGSLLYLTGSRMEFDEDDSTRYREVVGPVLAVDPERLGEVARADLPVDDVLASPTGDQLLAAGSWEQLGPSGLVLGTSGLYLLDAHSLEVVQHVEPPAEDASYQLAFSGDGRYAYAAVWFTAPYQEGSPITMVVDTETMEITELDLVLDRFNSELLELGYVLKE